APSHVTSGLYTLSLHDALPIWARQTGPDFRFVVKLPRVITHERRLSGVDEELRGFLAAVEPLGPRMHALWLQLPGSFGPVDLPLDRKSTRLNSSHDQSSYAVFC